MCYQLINQPWESLRLTWDYDPSFTGQSVITDNNTRLWIKNEMLAKAKNDIQKLLKVKRV